MASAGESDVVGTGHGSAHIWVDKGTDQVGSGDVRRKCTHYECSVCGVRFGHHYDVFFDIFREMELIGIPAVCQPQILPQLGATNN
jgi:hypothetical protein